MDDIVSYSEKIKLEKEELSLPKGGGALKGLNQNFHPNLFKGEAVYRIPIFTSECRGFYPKLELVYQSMSGNGVFGQGFHLNLPSICRKTEQAVPRYQDKEDIFIFSEVGELTFCKQYEDEKGNGVFLYLPIVEKEFISIRFIKEKENSKTYWLVTTKDNIHYKYGTDRKGCIFHPEYKEKVYQWFLCEVLDNRGNKIIYEYQQETENCYLSKIKYGNFFKKNQEEDYFFEITFQYSETRPDIFSSYRSGFLIETRRRCEEINLFHRNPIEKVKVRKTCFSYEPESRISLLSKVEVKGFSFSKDQTEQVLPPIFFSYSKFQPQSSLFQKLEVAAHPIPVSFEEQEYLFLDLYGEGIEGILYRDQNKVLYASPTGKGSYAAFQPLRKFPLEFSLEGKNKPLGYTFTSLEGNGKYDLLVSLPKQNGFYEQNKGEFQAFQAFEKIAEEINSPFLELTDMQGDHCSHLVVVDSKNIKYYPSLKKKGYGSPILTKAPEHFPHKGQSSKKQVVKFLDLFGDGQKHRVKIQNKSVQCFPNLGYGKFGEMKEMENAPFFEKEFDASRLYFADIDGSGTTDLIYVYANYVKIFLNQCGKHFLEGIRVDLPNVFDRLDKICFADVNGMGYKSMIFTKLGTVTEHYLLDFNQGKKPYLLNQVENNMGLVHKIFYESSSILCLEAKKEGLEWKKGLPFPVQVVKESVLLDVITDNEVVTKYHYRDPEYDFQKRMFRGFGSVESVTFQKQKQVPGMIPALHTKSWYHTGTGEIDYKNEFYQAEKEPVLTDVFELTALVSEKKKNLAMEGQLICEEIYGLDGSSQEKAAYQKKRFTYLVQERKAQGKEEEGSYRIKEQEMLFYNYEREPWDPRILHTILLEVDEYGNELGKATIRYKRKISEIEEQKKTSIQIEEKQYFNKENLIGIVTEERNYEILGQEAYLSKQQLKEKQAVWKKQKLPCEQPTSMKWNQARLLKWKKYYFWNQEADSMLEWGLVSDRALLHHVEEAVCSKEFLDGIYQNKVEEHILFKESGYFLEDGFWWNKGFTYHYAKDKFYLFIKQETSFIGEENPLYCKTELEYDPFCLLPIHQSDYLDFEKSNHIFAEIDYVFMKYKKIIDQNQNVSQVLFDSFGNVMAASFFGEEGTKRQGTLDLDKYQRKEGGKERILEAPGEYLQGASGFYYYDWNAYQKFGQPVSCIMLKGKDFLDTKEEEIRCSITYLDGMLRQIEEKHKAEEGWLVSEKSIFNWSGLSLVQYPPFLSEHFDFTKEAVSGKPTFHFYDIKNREIKCEIPREVLKGNGAIVSLFSKTIYKAWQRISYDFNETLKESSYYQKIMELSPVSIEILDKQDALKKAEKVCKMPSVLELDLYQNICLDRLKTEASACTAKFIYDIQGNEIAAADPRQNKKQGVNLTNFYDLQGKLLRADSVDKGRLLFVYNLFGNPVLKIDENQNVISYEYDHLNRRIGTYVKQVGLVEKVVYGDFAEKGEEKNLKGQVYQHFDQAGVETNESYHILGMVTKRSRQFTKEYKKEINWKEDQDLLEEIFSETFTYNADGAKKTHQMPNGRTLLMDYNLLGLVSCVSLEQKKDTQAVLKNIQYEPDGRYQSILYENGVNVSYQYNRISKELEAMSAVKGETLLQKLSYTQDGFGNITRIRSKQPILEADKEEAIFDYSYDPYYRLISATGRELTGSYTELFEYDFGNNLTKIHHHADSASFTTKLEIQEGSNRILQQDGQVIFYDNNGNRETVDPQKKAVWNFENQLIRVETKEESVPTGCEYYVYDYQGNRVRKITELFLETEEITEKIYIGNFQRKRRKQLKCRQETQILERDSIQIVLRDMLCVMGYFWNQERMQEFHYFVNNHINSVCMELDFTGQLLSYEEYYSFGGTAFTLAEKRERKLKEYRYAGKEQDETALYYFGARYYDGSRFLSADSLAYLNFGSWLSLNLYTYCNNNPLLYTDPDGHRLVLNGTAAEQGQILGALSSLTNQTLAIGAGGAVTITAAAPNHNLENGDLLVQRMINSTRTCDIFLQNMVGNYANWHNAGNAVNGVGTNAAVYFNPASSPMILTVDPITGNTAGAIRPSYVGLAHELIHADRGMRGRGQNLGHTADYTFQTGRVRKSFLCFSWWSKIKTTHYGVRKEELATVGLKNQRWRDITENDIRKEHGLSLRGAY